jgi:phosphate transport system permease protein
MAPATDSSSPMSWQRTDASRLLDKGFFWVTGAFAVGVAVILAAIALQVARDSLPAIQEFGLGFIAGIRWDPVENIYGAWPQVYGTLLTSGIALLLAVPIGIGVALFLSEDFLPSQIQRPIVFLIELLAAIPSVVYGLWGIFVLIPILNPIGGFLNSTLGFIPLFNSAPSGPSIFAAGVVLAIMILPIIAAISRDALVSVPPRLRQAAYGLGATRWEAIFRVVLPASISGIVGGVMLALGRAMGETMAVTMVIGNSNRVTGSIMDSGSTVSALLANQFAEAGGLQISALMYAALVLFGLTLVVNILAELLVRRVRLNLS